MKEAEWYPRCSGLVCRRVGVWKWASSISVLRACCGSYKETVDGSRLAREREERSTDVLRSELIDEKRSCEGLAARSTLDDELDKFLQPP
jgi:hypothetical protein